MIEYLSETKSNKSEELELHLDELMLPLMLNDEELEARISKDTPGGGTGGGGGC